MPQFRKISAFLLAFLVLYSSTSYSLNIHFCMGEVDSISLFDLGENCVMEVQKPACHESNGGISFAEKSKSCCEDQAVDVAAQDQIHQNSNISLHDFQLVALAYVLVPQLFDHSISQNITFQNYSPPLIKRDIPVLIQSFLL